MSRVVHGGGSNLFSLIIRRLLYHRLDIGISDVAFDRMRTAIAHLALDPIKQEKASVSPDREIILRGTALRDILLGSFKPGAQYGLVERDELGSSDQDQPSEVSEESLRIPTTVDDGYPLGSADGAFADDMRIMSWARRYSRPNPIHIDGDPALDGLNETQIRAAAMMIGQRASLVQGVSCSCFYAKGLELTYIDQPPGTGKTKTIIEVIRLLKVFCSL
jgi:hypothetical protein